MGFGQTHIYIYIYIHINADHVFVYTYIYIYRIVSFQGRRLGPGFWATRKQSDGGGLGMWEFGAADVGAFGPQGLGTISPVSSG